MTDDISQHIQTPPVRHAHRNLFNAQVARALDQLIEQGNDRFTAFDRKAFLAEVLGVQKALELFGRDQLPENSLLDFYIDRRGFDELAANLFTQPKLFFLTLNMPVFGAHLTAVGALLNVQNLAQRGAFSAGQATGNKQTIQVPNRQVVGFDVEFRMIKQRHRVQRIDVGDQMATHAIGIDQFHHVRLSNRLLMHLIGAEKEGIAIEIPAQRRVGNAEVGKNLVIESVFAEQQFMHASQERAG